MRIIIINGPNLNLTGIREKEIYGTESFDTYFKKISEKFPEIQFNYYQSNIEGEIINKLHETGFSYDGIVMNPGAYAHTSLAIADAVSAIQTPVIEVHLSNLFSREEIRQKSIVAPRCKGVISGFGMHSYELAVRSFMI
jgi:3-dehydroquinate dehydratase II